MKAKIVNENGDALESADIVTPVNLWLQSLWNQVDVFFQQKLVSSSGTNYAYKALIDVLLNYGHDAAPLNQGLIFRNKVAKSGAFIDMVGPIYADVFQMPRYLLNE